MRLLLNAPIFTNLKWPAIISAVLVTPFMLLEWVNRRAFHEDFPGVLFGLMWLLPVAFILMLVPIVRKVRLENSIMKNPTSLLLRTVGLILIVWLWASLVVDQVPCFLGVPNCD